MPDDIRQLLQSTHRGDREAAEKLWRAWGTRLAAYAAAILGCGAGEAAAMDCVQSVLCSVLAMKARDVERIDDPAAFLARGVRNAALQVRRVSTRERSHAERLREKFDPLTAQAVVGRSDEGQDQGWLKKQIEGLEDVDREIVLLRHIAGMTNEQIAIALQINRNTVASRYRRALDGLRARLAEHEGPAVAAPGAGADSRSGIPQNSTHARVNA